MRIKVILAIFCLLLTLSTSLYIKHNEEHKKKTQIEALLAQQNLFETKINELIGHVNEVQKQVNNTNSTDQKVIILESAIIMEREKIFNISNSIIPPFNLSENACHQLTNQQKIKLLDKVNETRVQLKKLKKITDGLSDCTQVQQIKSDIDKEEVLLDSIESIIYTKCKSNMVLSPTVFQSNLFASNWILGNQTIDDLIQEYYQRSQKYHNVTNCPDKKPFFNGVQCINCTFLTPVFNIHARRCEACPYDFHVNIKLRKCDRNPHYTNFSTLHNYNLDGTTLPKVDTKVPGLTPCPDVHPFYNGETCVSCDLPMYWSVKDHKCIKCPKHKIFDLNEKACKLPSGKALTILEGTRWVTLDGNITRVLEQRSHLLNTQEANQFHYCPEQNPYYDGIHCISCPNQFDIDTKECVKAPVNKTFNHNEHFYLKPDYTKQTNPYAPNLLGTLPLDTQKQNCPFEKPYFDGTACVHCQEPFILFDIASKKCVTCAATEVYNSNTMTCEKRKVFIISPNMNRLMATDRVSVADYKKQLMGKLNDPEALIQKCPDSLAYTNYTNCIYCKPDQFFNIQTKRCHICNGTIDPATRICDQLKTLITDLKNPNLLLTGNQTIEDQQKKQDKIDGPTKVCPPQMPYSRDGLRCFGCQMPNIYYDLASKICKACPQKNFYNPATKRCQKAVTVTNVDEIHRVVEVENYTLANLRAQIKSSTFPTLACSSQKPLFNGKQCISCPLVTFYDLKTLTCITAKRVTNVEQLQKTKLFKQEGNATLEYIKYEIEAIKPYPTSACQPKKPVWNGANCTGCGYGQYINLQTFECKQAKPVSNLSALTSKGNYVEIGGYTMDKLEKQIEQSTIPTISCPQKLPFWTGTDCINCHSGLFFDLQTGNCVKAKTVSNVNQLRNLSNVVQIGESTLDNIENETFYQQLPTTPCDDSKPLWNGELCIKCDNGLFYNLKTLECMQSMKTTNVEELLKQRKFVIQDKENNLDQLKNKTQNGILPTTPCEAQTPLFNGTQCISCENGSFYNLKDSSCLEPTSTTNVNALRNQIVKQTNSTTLDSIDEQNKKIETKLPTIVCPDQTPLFNGSQCIGCNSSVQYYDLEKFSCQNYPKITNVDALEKSGSFVEQGNSTIEKIKEDIENLKPIPGIPCPEDKPFASNDSNCYGCQKFQYINLQTQVCKPKILATNVEAVKKLGKYVESGNDTMDSIQQAIYNSPIPTIPCPSSNPFYNGLACTSCKEAKFYNLQTGKCIQAQTVTNVAALRNSSYVLEGENDTLDSLETSISASKLPTTECDESVPLFNGYECISCPNGSYYALKTKGCIQAVNISNIAALKASYIKQQENTTVESLEEEYSYIPIPTKECPYEKPLYNTQTKECILCPALYNLEEMKCEGPHIHTNVAAVQESNYTAKNDTLEKLKTEVQQLPDPKQPCPLESPLFNGFECINCTDQLYDLDQLKCHECTIEEFYNAELHICEKNPTYYPNLANVNWIVGNYSDPLDVYKMTNHLKAEQKSIECPLETPFLNNQSKDCVSCENGTYFNYDTSECQACEDGLEYNPNQHKCMERLVGVYHTSLERQSLLFGGMPVLEHQEIYDTNKKEHPNIQDCPLEKPYFDGFACVECIQPTPRFNLKTQMCTKCVEPAKYDAKYHECLASGKPITTTPNIAKMYSGIF